MIYKFRICMDPDRRDDAQGWVVASSELHAREIVGQDAYLHLMPYSPSILISEGTVVITKGAMP